MNAAFNKAVSATGDATLKTSEVESNKQRLAEQEAEAASLKGKIIAADQAAARLPDLDKKIQENSTPVPFIPGQGDLSAKLEAQRQGELSKLQAERDQVANAAGGANDGDRRRLEQLRGKDGISGENKDLAKSIEALAKAAESLQETARKAQGDYQVVRQEETAKLGGDFEATKRRLKTNQITSDSSARKSAREAQKKREDKADKARQKAATESGKNAREAGSTARSAEGLIPKGVSDKFRKDFQTVSDGLQNGDQGGEVAKMLSMIESLANAVEKKGNDKDLARRLDIMEQRIRNLGK